MLDLKQNIIEQIDFCERADSHHSHQKVFSICCNSFKHIVVIYFLYYLWKMLIIIHRL